MTGATGSALTSRRPPVWGLLKQTWRARRTISRALMNMELDRAGPFRGTVLDLGAGGRPSYLQFLSFAAQSRFITLDAAAHSRPSVVANIEGALPFADRCVDVVLLLNVLEHIFDHAALIREVGRVLRPGGTLYLATPFLVGVHTSGGDGRFFVDDFFRYSRSTLGRLLRDAGGFADVTVIAHGGLFTSAANLLLPALKVAPLWVPVLTAALLLDRLVDRRFPANRDKWMMQYFTIARKAPP